MTLARRPGESFEAYKIRRKRENKEARERTRGTVVWNSSNMIKKPDGTIGELVKVRNEGTYIKGVAKLHSSHSDKNKYDRLKAKAIKRKLKEREDAKLES